MGNGTVNLITRWFGNGLLITYTEDKFPSEYVPKIIGGNVAEVKIREETYQLQLWDTVTNSVDNSVSQEQYDRLRPLSYPDTTIFLVCFSVCDPASFKNVQEKWVPEIKHHCPNIPFLLVGTQVDLRYDRAVLDKLAKNKEKPVSKEAGEMLATSLKAAKYVECSALTGEGIKNVFDKAFIHDVECRKENVKKTKLNKRGCFVF